MTITKLKSILSNQAGGSHLVLVLIVAFILVLILSSVQFLAFINLKQTARVNFSHRAYFSAEGALFETINHLKSDPTWPPTLPFTDSYNINDVEIDRHIDLDPDTGEVIVTINADSRGARRKLVGRFAPVSSDQTSNLPLDIVLLFDRSGSMGEWQLPDGTATAISIAKQAAINFVDSISQVSNAQVGFVAYNNQVYPQAPNQGYFPLSPIQDSTQLTGIIDGVWATNATNISAALDQARIEFEERGRSNTQKIIILLSDGVPSKALPTPPEHPAGSEGLVTCPSDACISPSGSATGFEPLNRGIYCTDNAISIASDLKANDVTIFSVFISNYAQVDSSKIHCGINSRAEELGLNTMFDISSETGILATTTDPTYFKQTTNLDELDQIYQDIAGTVTTPGFFQYFETEPDSSP